MNSIEICFTPALYGHILTEPPFTVAIVDILRATTSICAAFDNQVKEIIPVATTEEALEYKNKGYLIAAERNGIKLDFADFGNSPDNFTKDHVRGRSIVYSTTNGTQTIKRITNGSPVVIASFINLKAAANYIASKNQNLVIVCAGWKNKFNLEDSVFAGALTAELLEMGMTMNCDSAQAAVDLWSIARHDPVAYIQKAMHRERLKKLNLDSILGYCFTPDQTSVVPVFDGHRIINAVSNE
ncbi:putative 2-phosphosulfolactate phosphatase [bioreactor metagenome]|uniref:2-phosphosulfolactate phosphatase n=1 Tax=bioreactor metagenome TaxID=1076179 RepID=A0A644WEX7_9ZZZZ